MSSGHGHVSPWSDSALRRSESAVSVREGEKSEPTTETMPGRAARQSRKERGVSERRRRELESARRPASAKRKHSRTVEERETPGPTKVRGGTGPRRRKKTENRGKGEGPTRERSRPDGPGAVEKPRSEATQQRAEPGGPKSHEASKRACPRRGQGRPEKKQPDESRSRWRPRRSSSTPEGCPGAPKRKARSNRPGRNPFQQSECTQSGSPAVGI